MVVAKYHPEITSVLRDGALAAYKARFGSSDAVRVFEVPGVFEIPHMLSLLMAHERYFGFVALGCVVKGETSHDRVLGDAVTQAIATLSLEFPVGLGVLTVQSLDQARERAGGKLGNKGADAMEAAICLIDAADRLSLEHAEQLEQEGRKLSHTGGSRSTHKPRKKESR